MVTEERTQDTDDVDNLTPQERNDHALGLDPSPSKTVEAYDSDEPMHFRIYARSRNQAYPVQRIIDQTFARVLRIPVEYDIQVIGKDDPNYKLEELPIVEGTATVGQPAVEFDSFVADFSSVIQDLVHARRTAVYSYTRESGDSDDASEKPKKSKGHQ